MSPKKKLFAFQVKPYVVPDKGLLGSQHHNFRYL